MIAIIVVSKDEPALEATIRDLASVASPTPFEVVVVDASAGRLDWVRQLFPDVRWIDFESNETGVSIPQQRNVGLRATGDADIIVFTDAGCRVEPEWLSNLASPIVSGAEHVTAGLTRGSGPWKGLYEPDSEVAGGYLEEAATINLALAREVIDGIGEFDEGFEYGSDIDYTWRVVEGGYRIRSVPDALVVHDWGSRRRQIRRSYRYGKARARLSRKHFTSVRELVRRDPVLVFYPMFLLSSPLALVFPPYLLLLLIPAWRARYSRPFVTVLDHLVYGAGALVEVGLVIRAGLHGGVTGRSRAAT